VPARPHRPLRVLPLKGSAYPRVREDLREDDGGSIGRAIALHTHRAAGAAVYWIRWLRIGPAPGGAAHLAAPMGPGNPSLRLPGERLLLRHAAPGQLPAHPRRTWEQSTRTRAVAHAHSLSQTHGTAGAGPGLRRGVSG